MVNVYVLAPGEELDLDRARTAKTIYHTNPLHPSYGILVEAQLPVKPASNGTLEQGDLLIVAPQTTSEHPSLSELVTVMNRLLGPGGCPWDQEQTHESLKRYLLEEAYEVLDAIDSGSDDNLKEELGDLLLQPIFHAQIAARDGRFSIDEVAQGIVEKLIRRHPHVFGDVSVANAAEVLKNWDQIKKQEKAEEARSILAGVPSGMASLLRAHDISKRAARAGFEWPNIEGVFEKLHEELKELDDAMASQEKSHIEAEIGDLLFTVVNIARWCEVEPEEALRKMLNRFTARFKLMEAYATKPLNQLSPQEWDDLWNSSKATLASTPLG